LACVAHIEEMRNAYKILVWKLGKRPIGHLGVGGRITGSCK